MFVLCVSYLYIWVTDITELKTNKFGWLLWSNKTQTFSGMTCRKCSTEHYVYVPVTQFKSVTLSSFLNTAGNRRTSRSPAHSTGMIVWGNEASHFPELRRLITLTIFPRRRNPKERKSYRSAHNSDAQEFPTWWTARNLILAPHLSNFDLYVCYKLDF
jgi:hypothetical protein